MCDYCDCRTHPAIASLSAEHEVVLELLGDLRRAAAVQDRATGVAVLARLHDVLSAHATREERGVFNALRHAGISHSYLDWFERDHGRIHALLDTSVTEHREDWQGAAEELVHLLVDHILREESDLFPVAHQVLSPRQWDEVDAVHERLIHPNVANPNHAGVA